MPILSTGGILYDGTGNIAALTNVAWDGLTHEVLEARTMDPVTTLNASFEAAALASWTETGTPDTSERSNEQAHTDTYSLKHIESSETGVHGRYQEVTVVEGRTYTVQVWIYCTAVGSSPTLGIYTTDGTNTEHSLATANSAWTKHSITIAPAASTTLTISLYGEGTAYFDDVNVLGGMYAEPARGLKTGGQITATVFYAVDETSHDSSTHGILYDMDTDGSSNTTWRVYFQGAAYNVYHSAPIIMTEVRLVSNIGEFQILEMSAEIAGDVTLDTIPVA